MCMRLKHRWGQAPTERAKNGKDAMKQTSQRSLLFRQNVGRTEEEWVHFLDGYRKSLIEFGMQRTGVDALCHSSSFQ